MESEKEINPADPYVEKLLAHQTELTRFVAAALAALPAQVEDVVQETNLALLRRKSLFDTSRPFLPWLIAHAKKQALAALKRSTHEHLVFDNDFLEAIAKEASSEPDDSPLLTRLRICRAKLKPEQKELLAMRYDREMSLQEICRKTKRSNLSVRSELSYLRRKLAGCVRQKCALPETAPAFNEALSLAVEEGGELPTMQNAQEWLDEFGYHALLRRYRAIPTKTPLKRKWQAATLFVGVSAVAATVALKSFSGKTAVSVGEHSSLSTTNTQVSADEELSVKNLSQEQTVAKSSSATDTRGDTMKPKTTWLAAALSIFGATSQAAEWKMSANDGKPSAGSPNTSFNSIGKWVDRATGKTAATSAPSAGNEYYATYTMRTPYSATAETFTFGGDKLTISSWFGSDSASGSTIVINNCHFANNPRLCINNASCSAKWEGNLWTLDAKAQLHLLLSQTGTTGHSIWAPFAGDSSTSIICEFTGTDTSPKQILLQVSSPEFYGRSYIQSTLDDISVPGSLAYVHAYKEDSFGPQPETFQKDWLTFSGGSLRCETDWTGTNRGIWITASGNYPARATLIEADGNTRILPNQIGGDGDLYKTGGGTIKLTGKISLTGLIHVKVGSLQLTSQEEISCKEIKSSNGGTIGLLTDSHVEKVTVESKNFNISGLGVNAGEISFAQDTSIYVNPFDNWSEGTPLIKADRQISAAANSIIRFYGTGTGSQKEIILLEAPKLENIEVANILFDDWTMSIAKTTADGLERIVATPNPVAYLANGDSAGTSAFSIANRWNPAIAPNSTQGASYIYAIRDNKLLRTPEKTVETFGGKRLMVYNNRTIALKSAQGCTIDDLVFSLGQLSTAADTTWLAGTLTTMSYNGASCLTIQHTINTRTFNLASNLRGMGAIAILFNGDPEYTTNLGRINLSGDNTMFHSTLGCRGNSNGVVVASSSVAIPKDIILWGAGLGVDHDAVMPSSTKLSMNMADITVASGTEAGTLPAGKTTLPGGANLWALDGAVFTVEPAITTSGTVNRPLRIHGRDGGTVVLSGNNSAIKSAVELVEGATVAANPNALGAGDVTIQSGATLLLPYPLPATMPNGVNIAKALTIEEGANISLKVAEGTTLTSGTRVPLFTLPAGHSMTPADFHVQKPAGSGNLLAEVSIEGRQVYATFRIAGTVIMLLGGN